VNFGVSSNLGAVNLFCYEIDLKTSRNGTFIHFHYVSFFRLKN